jgi:hypothetical protein
MPEKRFSHVHIDIVGPLPASSQGHTHNGGPEHEVARGHSIGQHDHPQLLSPARTITTELGKSQIRRQQIDVGLFLYIFLLWRRMSESGGLEK